MLKNKIMKLKLIKTHLIIILVFSTLGMLASLMAQRGGINQINGFLAPILGPWSFCLPPNPKRLMNWETYKVFKAISIGLTVVLLVSTSLIVKNKVLKIIFSLLGYISLVYWCLLGLAKVFVELT